MLIPFKEQKSRIFFFRQHLDKKFNSSPYLSRNLRSEKKHAVREAHLRSILSLSLLSARRFVHLFAKRSSVVLAAQTCILIPRLSKRRSRRASSYRRRFPRRHKLCRGNYGVAKVSRVVYTRNATSTTHC